MAKRIHLKDSDEPLKLGETVKVNCGIDLPNSQVVMALDEDLFGVYPTLRRHRFCNDCVKQGLTHRYIYGLVEGQQAIDQGNSQEEG